MGKLKLTKTKNPFDNTTEYSVTLIFKYKVANDAVVPEEYIADMAIGNLTKTLNQYEGCEIEEKEYLPLDKLKDTFEGRINERLASLLELYVQKYGPIGG